MRRPGSDSGAAGTVAMPHCDGQDRRVVTTRRLRAWLPGRSRVTGGAARAAAAPEARCTRSALAARAPAALIPKERKRTQATLTRFRGPGPVQGAAATMRGAGALCEGFHEMLPRKRY